MYNNFVSGKREEETAVNKWEKKMNEIITEFSGLLKQKLSNHIKNITLFGSRARGDHKEHSDYDFLIIVDKKNRMIMNEIREIEVGILDRFDALVGSVVYNEPEWEKRKNFPFGINIHKDGIKIL